MVKKKNMVKPLYLTVKNGQKSPRKILMVQKVGPLKFPPILMRQFTGHLVSIFRTNGRSRLRQHDAR